MDKQGVKTSDGPDTKHVKITNFSKGGVDYNETKKEKQVFYLHLQI